MNFIKRFFFGLLLIFGVFNPNIAFAFGIIDINSLDISGLVPLVLDAFMFVANGTYAYFVGNGDGIVYLLVWGFLIFYIISYLIKLYIPKFWLAAFRFKSGDSIDNVGGMKIAENLLKPALRALVAVILLLPLHPEFIARNVINPFLSFGSLYTKEIIQISSGIGFQDEKQIKCPENLLDQGWLDKKSCDYLIQPVHILSHANNHIVKQGFTYLSNGLRALQTLFVHDNGQGFMSIITGILLIVTFVGCNIFMALLIIQAIFNFGMALILYPFNVAAWVARKSDAWFDIWPAFSGIIEALKQIVVTMIACAFITCINLALVRALFQWNNNVFVAAAGGVAYSNLLSAQSASVGFGGHSMVWLSCLLTFFLMNKIFEITKDKLNEYTGKNLTGLYDSVKSDTKTIWGRLKSTPQKINNIKKAAGK